MNETCGAISRFGHYPCDNMAVMGSGRCHEHMNRMTETIRRVETPIPTCTYLYSSTGRKCPGDILPGRYYCALHQTLQFGRGPMSSSLPELETPRLFTRRKRALTL